MLSKITKILFISLPFLLIPLFLPDTSISNNKNTKADKETYAYIEDVLLQPSEVLKGTDQLIIVTNKKKQPGESTIHAYEKINEQWQPAFEAFPGTVGKKGFALPGEKREGDSKSPSGIYAIGTAFGYAKTVKTNLPYRQSTDKDLWIDDVNSEDYNKWISGKTSATSFEKMKRKDHLYKYGFVVEYNTNPIVKGMGSAIFFHIWRAPGRPTLGCIATTEKNILHLISWLDASKKPKVIMGAPETLSSLF